jgi:hypothetical protein
MKTLGDEAVLIWASQRNGGPVVDESPLIGMNRHMRSAPSGELFLATLKPPSPVICSMSPVE